MVSSLNYCRLLRILRRNGSISKFGQTLMVFLIIFFFMISVYGIARNYVFEASNITMNTIESNGQPNLYYTEDGSIMNISGKILFDSIERQYMDRLIDPFNISGTLWYSRNDSGFLINFDDLVELAGYIDPYPLRSILHFYVEVTVITGNLLFTLEMNNYRESKYVSFKHEILEFTYVDEEYEGFYYDFKSFRFLIKSLSEETKIFLGRIQVILENNMTFAPLRITYFDMYGNQINESYIVKDGTLYSLGVGFLYLHFEYYSPTLMKLISIYAKYPLDTIYFESNVTINKISAIIDSFTYAEFEMARQVIVPEGRGLNMSVFLPLYRIDFKVSYINYPAEIEDLEISYYYKLIISVDRIMFSRYNKISFLLIPGEYFISIWIRGSLRDFLVSFKINVENEDMLIEIKINAYYLNGVVLRADDFIFLLLMTSGGIFILILPLILSDTRERYLQVLRRPIFYAMILLVASAFMPSLIIPNYYNGYIGRSEQLMVIDFPLVIFYKDASESVYKAAFSLFGFLYSFLFALLWFFYPLFTILGEMKKTSIEINVIQLKKIAKISLLAKTIYLSFPTIMAHLDPYTQILMITPGPGLFLYGCFIVLTLIEIKRKTELNLINVNED